MSNCIALTDLLKRLNDESEGSASVKLTWSDNDGFAAMVVDEKGRQTILASDGNSALYTKGWNSPDAALMALSIIEERAYAAYLAENPEEAT